MAPDKHIVTRTSSAHTSSAHTFTEEDRRILAAMRPLVRGLASFLGSHCEVLMHSLEDLAHSIVQIENGHVTGRTVGSPVTDLALRILHSTDGGTANGGTADGGDFRVYSSSTADGKPLRCVTMVVRNGDQPIGMLCINFDLTIPVHEVIALLGGSVDGSSREAVGRGTESGTDGGNEREDSPEHYMMSAEDLVTHSIDLAIQKATSQRGVSPQARNRAIVADLNIQGIFDIKGAVEMVSAELGVSRFTVYNYLRDLRNDGETNGK